MAPYEELPHTADILIRVRATSLPELFETSAKALMDNMYNCSNGNLKPLKSYSITLSGSDFEELIQMFLSEVLFYAETENYVFSNFSVDITDDNNGEISLTSSMDYESFDPKIHGGGSEVKGISFYRLKIEKIDNEFVTDILFDV